MSLQTDHFRFFVLFESQHFFISGHDDISFARDLSRQAFTFNKALGAGSAMAPPLKVNFKKALVFWVTSSHVTKFLRCENRGGGPTLLISEIWPGRDNPKGPISLCILLFDALFL
jgi:hypothetical protein